MQKSILIGIPSLDSIKTETVASLFSATAQIDYPTKLHIHKSSLIHHARNEIVDAAIEMGASHLMFIDSDISFQPDAINRLIAHDKDIVGGMYYRRQPPHLPTIHQRVGDALTVPRKFPTDRLFEVFSIATGFLLIKTSVFKELQKPYFYYGKFHGKEVGEDVYFCWKAGKKFKIWCDPTIELGHVGEYCFDKNDFDAYEDVRPKENEDVFDGQL